MRVVRLLARLRARIGRRGASLLFLALLDTVYGLGLVMLSELPRSHVYRFAGDVAPLGVWAALWFTVGAVCAVQALMLRDQVAFAAASALKVGWGGMIFLGWLMGDIPRGYVSAAIWGAFAAWVFIISGWIENDAAGRGR